MSTSSGPSIVFPGQVISLDGANKRSYSPNVHPNSTDIFGWGTSNGLTTAGNNCTVSRDTTVQSPVGNTPLKMVTSGNDSHWNTYNPAVWNLAPAAVGETWTFSAYVKSNFPSVVQLFIFGSLTAGGFLEAPAGGANVTTEWTRVSFTYTFANAGTQSIQIRLDGPDTFASGLVIWWDGLQVERNSTPTTFNPYSYNSAQLVKDLSVNQFNLPLTTNDVFSSSNQGSVNFTTALAGRNQTSFYNSTGPFVGSKDPIQWDGDCTYDVWFSPSIVNATVRYILSDSNDNEGLLDFTSTRVRASFGGSNTITYSVVLQPNTWYHAAVVHQRDVASDLYRLSLYFNGSLIQQVQNNVISTTSSVYGPDTSMRVGTSFQGRIGSLKIYNKSFSASEVRQNFNALRGRYGI